MGGVETSGHCLQIRITQKKIACCARIHSGQKSIFFFYFAATQVKIKPKRMSCAKKSTNSFDEHLIENDARLERKKIDLAD